MRSKFTIPESHIERMANDFIKVRDDIEDVFNKWNDLYDERSCNEPEYDSQIERWQQSLDDLEEAKDALEEVVNNLTDWIEDFQDWKGNNGVERSYYVEYDVDYETLEGIVSDLNEVRSMRRGLKKQYDALLNLRNTVKYRIKYPMGQTIVTSNGQVLTPME